MTALNQIIASQIHANGPMTIAQYMTTCLLHPQHGYYTTRQPLGAKGDFTTAPEISQMFGELIGLCLAQTWLDQGRPAEFILCELGPGRGTLMADVMRATRSVPGFHDAASIALVEASPTLREEQAQALTDATPHWYDSFDQVPDGPIYLVANEFFDALPVRQFIRAGDGWSERMVGLDSDALTFGLTQAQPRPELAHRLEDTNEGDLVETCTAANTIAQSIAARIDTNGGAALIIDYGDWRSLGDTLQAVSDHRKVNPLDTPGQADLTAHVDFEALLTGLPCLHSRVTPQGVFLERLGITARAQTLAQNLSGQARNTHITAHRRLTHPDEMGTLFKTCALYPKGTTPPPGFEP